MIGCLVVKLACQPLVCLIHLDGQIASEEQVIMQLGRAVFQVQHRRLGGRVTTCSDCKGVTGCVDDVIQRDKPSGDILFKPRSGLCFIDAIDGTGTEFFVSTCHCGDGQTGDFN